MHISTTKPLTIATLTNALRKEDPETTEHIQTNSGSIPEPSDAHPGKERPGKGRGSAPLLRSGARGLRAVKQHAALTVDHLHILELVMLDVGKVLTKGGAELLLAAAEVRARNILAVIQDLQTKM